MLNTIADVVSNTTVLMSLWKHESYRVIADRFTEQTDKDWFEKTIQQVKNKSYLYLVNYHAVCMIISLLR